MNGLLYLIFVLNFNNALFISLKLHLEKSAICSEHSVASAKHVHLLFFFSVGTSVVKCCFEHLSFPTALVSNLVNSRVHSTDANIVPVFQTELGIVLVASVSCCTNMQTSHQTLQQLQANIMSL